ncbi:hypothetical protein AAG570_004911 [Ranatra chinensis]|uniref:Mitochondrial import receptor subunit TOM20 n=1 Tax=Ranatra chinensis TaxID=642074 RepID=A0ABD0XYX3_9HEMI
MSTSPKTALGVATGICAALFVGYCIYFDRRRRCDPDFKRKLVERRRAARLAASRPQIELPDLRDHEAVQMFFLEQVQAAEELLGRGDVERGIDHIANAVAVCGRPGQLLEVLQQTLPAHLFDALLMRLPQLRRRIRDNPCGQRAQ